MTSSCTSTGYVGPPPLGGGSIEVIVIDCSGVPNGTAYTNPGCNTCMGGNTGITECPPTTIKFKLDSFPCAKALVQQMATLNVDISNLIQNSFGKNDKINLTIQEDPTLAGTSTDGQTGNVQAFIAGSTIGYDATIGINPDVLKYATKEFILVTIYHEALHAYLGYKQLQLGNAEFNNQFTGLQVNGGWLLGVQDPQHWTMGYSNFVNGLKNVILAYNPSFDPNRADAMALGGIGYLTPAQTTINLQEKNTRLSGYTGSKCP